MLASSFVGAILHLLVLCPWCQAFIWAPSKSQKTHTTITEQGVFLAAKEYLSRNPSYNIGCVTKQAPYKTAVQELVDGNTFVDRNDTMYWQSWVHFDSEQHPDAIEHIAMRRSNAKAAVQKGDFSRARTEIGHSLHTVQDFYSHSNWVEMGNTKPSPGTLGTTKDFGVPWAKPDQKVCKPCNSSSGWCYGNVVLDVLTTAYYSKETNKKGEQMPKNGKKCSHGGGADKGSVIDPIGGIDKDYPTQTSPHGYLHNKAGAVAEEATKEILLDFGKDIGNEAFEKFLALNQPKCKSSGASAQGGEKTQIKGKSGGKGKRSPRRRRNVRSVGRM